MVPIWLKSDLSIATLCSYVAAPGEIWEISITSHMWVITVPANKKRQSWHYESVTKLLCLLRAIRFAEICHSHIHHIIIYSWHYVIHSWLVIGISQISPWSIRAHPDKHNSIDVKIHHCECNELHWPFRKKYALNIIIFL
jgi:hypothetical protein